MPSDPKITEEPLEGGGEEGDKFALQPGLCCDFWATVVTPACRVCRHKGSQTVPGSPRDSWYATQRQIKVQLYPGTRGSGAVLGWSFVICNDTSEGATKGSVDGINGDRAFRSLPAWVVTLLMVNGAFQPRCAVSLGRVATRVALLWD
jgi:hypothetical protein